MPVLSLFHGSVLVGIRLERSCPLLYVVNGHVLTLDVRSCSFVNETSKQLILTPAPPWASMASGVDGMISPP
jgi:hypothetical protein